METAKTKTVNRVVETTPAAALRAVQKPAARLGYEAPMPSATQSGESVEGAEQGAAADSALQSPYLARFAVGGGLKQTAKREEQVEARPSVGWTETAASAEGRQGDKERAAATPPVIGAGQARAAGEQVAPAGASEAGRAAQPAPAPGTPASAATSAPARAEAGAPQARSAGAAPEAAPVAAEGKGAEEEQRTEASVGGATLGQIAAAPPAQEQLHAVAQAALIVSDCARSEAEVARIATGRQQQVSVQFAGIRGGLTAFFSNTIVGMQVLIAAKQAELISATAQTLATVAAAVASGVQTAQAFAAQITGRVHALVERATSAAQEGVAGIARRIIRVIDSVPLPDVPGIAQIRGVAANLLQQAVGGVNWVLGQVSRFIGAALATGLAVLNTLLGGFQRLVAAALSLATTALLNIMRLVSQALNRAIGFIVALLGRVLFGVVMPLLQRVEALINRYLNWAAQRARGRIRANGEAFLRVLRVAVTPGPVTRAQGDRAASVEGRIAAIQQLGRDALRNNLTIVQSFAALSGATLLSIIRRVFSFAGWIVAGIRTLLGRVVLFIVSTVIRVVQQLRRMAQAVAELVRELFQALSATLGRLVALVQSLAADVVDRLTRYAGNALERMRGFVVRVVSRLIRGLSGAASSIREVIGEFSRSGLSTDRLSALLSGPIVIPAPAPIIIVVNLIFAAIVTAVSAVLVFLFGAELAAIIMANPLFWIILFVVLALLLLLLLMLLLYLLYRLIKPKPPKPPTKRVLRVTPAVLELGVGGRDLRASATIAPGLPLWPSLTWTINPGGAAPAGVAVLGSFGRWVWVRASHPPHGTIVGGVPITVRAALSSNPADFADSASVMLVQVLSAAYTAAPPLANVPSLIPGVAPLNTAEPNRDGIAGNTAVVNAVTAPATRPINVSFRFLRALGASVTGTTITPGSRTGDIGLRIRDTATDATLDETRPATVGPAALMADLTVNAVPTRVSALAGAGPLGPYGVLNSITFAPSDTVHPPLARIVGELITNGGDDFNVPPPNGAFNPGFLLNLAVPANSWNDQLITPVGITNVADGRPAIDVNRFVGPGVPQLPRRLIYRQRFQYSAWQGAGTVISRTIDDGRHIRSLIGAPPAFQFRTEHHFGAVAAPVRNEPYVGNPLIVLSNVTATPDGPGATGLAADGAATAQLGVTSSVPGRTVRWSVLSGDMTITAGNPAALPATATLRSGLRTGNFQVRAADTIFPNRRVDARVLLEPVALRNMRAAPGNVPPGTASTVVSLDAEPGGRVVLWSVDAAAAAAGVTVTPPVTGPGPAPMNATVTRPAGFTGRVTVTARDAVLGARTASVGIRFR